jgi:hypothetical protein
MNTANASMLKAVLGNEFLPEILGKEGAAAVIAAPLPTAPGVIPSRRPAGSTPSSRKQEVRSLLEQSMAQLNYNDEVMSSLVEAMSSYVENCIREA